MNIHSVFKCTALSILFAASSVQSAHAVNIAIIDTGLNSGVLGNFIEPGGFDFVNNDSDFSDASSNQHGTNVGLVAVSSGSNVSLTGIKAFEDATSGSNSTVAAAFDYVATLGGVQVVNYSGAQLTNIPLASIKANTDAGKIVVFQAGNSAGANPAGDAGKASALGGLAIVAGGLTPDGSDIQLYSNRAGSQKDFYVLAHTGSIDGSLDGTSMSAPRVSAAAATILDRFAFLSPEQVVQIIFESADDLGEPGVDSTYGNGALNVDAALTAVGTGNIPTPGGDGGGGGGSGGIIALVLGGAVAHSLINEEEKLQKTILVDDYGRAYRFGFASRLSVNNSSPNVFSLRENQKNNFDSVLLGSHQSGYTQAFLAEVAVKPYSFTAGDEILDRYVSFLHRTQTPNTQYAMALNADLATDFGALSLRKNDQTSDPSKFYMSDLFSTPILGYSSMGSSFMYGWNKDTVNHRFGLSVVNDQQDHGHVSNSLLYESSINKDLFRIGMQLGALIEDGSLLGGDSETALGVDETKTYYLGLNGSVNVSKNVSVLGGYFQGVSSVDESRNSLLSDVSGIRTQGYAVGVLIDNLFTPKGSFGLSYSNPLQTTHGSATLTLPVSQDGDTGAIGFESSDLSFSGNKNEKIFEAYYNYQINRSNNLFTHFSYTKNPLGNLDETKNRTIYVGWRRQF